MKLKIFSLKFYYQPQNQVQNNSKWNPSQNNFLELLNSNMNKINSVDNSIYILGDFNLFLNDSYILKKIISWAAGSFQVMLKATMKFVHFLD